MADDGERADPLLLRISTLAAELRIHIVRFAGILLTREELDIAVRLFRADRVRAEEQYGPFHRWRYMRRRPRPQNLHHLEAMLGAYNPDTDFPVEFWDVSGITDMSYLFAHDAVVLPPGTDLSHWDVSNVTDMREMFMNSTANLVISRWDTSSVLVMFGMFQLTRAVCDISSWNVSSVRNFDYMFEGSDDTSDVSRFNMTGRRVTCYHMFHGSQIPRERRPPHFQ